MLHLVRIQVLVLVITSLQRTCFAAPRSGRGFCATAGPNDSLREAFVRLTMPGNDGAYDQESRKAVEPIEIETWFHVVSSKANANVVSDEMITTQVSIYPSPTAVGIIYQVVSKY